MEQRKTTSNRNYRTVAIRGCRVAIGLEADGSRLWAGPPRRAASLSLRLPGNAPQGRVSSASAHTGPTRRTAALDGFQKSPSLRRGRRAGPLAPGRRAPSCDAPHGSRLLGVGSTVAHLPGLALPRQPVRSVQARYGFRCTESSCPPAAGRRAAPRSLSPKG